MGCNAKKLHKVHKKLDEMTKAFQGSEIQKKGVTNTFSRKLQKTTKELDLDIFGNNFQIHNTLKNQK